jgi:hypothetical protein
VTDREALEADCGADPELRDLFLAMPGPDDKAVPSAREQAWALAMPVESWRHRVARLIALGLATYGPTHNGGACTLKVSSYWLTERGTALRDAMEPFWLQRPTQSSRSGVTSMPTNAAQIDERWEKPQAQAVGPYLQANGSLRPYFVSRPVNR